MSCLAPGLKNDRGTDAMQPEVIDPQIPLLKDEKTRREAWIETISAIWVSTPDRDKPFPEEVNFRAWNLGNMIMSKLHASTQTVERTRSQIAAQFVDHIYFQYHLSGQSKIDATSSETPLHDGDIALIDMSQPIFAHAYTGVDAIGLTIPRRAFDTRVGEMGDLHRSVLSRRGQPLVRLFSDHLQNMRHCLDSADDS